MLDRAGTGEVGVADIGDVMRAFGHDADDTELRKMIHEVDLRGTWYMQ